jgi:hypothetical protein
MKIEVSPSGRAACRGCKKPVAKGELRFAESYALPGGDEGFRYWHLACAAPKLGTHLKGAMSAYGGDIPDREALEATIAKAPQKTVDRPLPHVDRAPTGRAKCMVCAEPIEKGSHRIAVERELETGAFVTRGAGYLHPKCARGWTRENLEDESQIADWMKAMFDNSGMEQAEIAEVTKLLETGEAG